MHSQAAHPEVLALALIVLVLGVEAGPERALAPLGERLDSPKPRRFHPPPAADGAVSL